MTKIAKYKDVLLTGLITVGIALGGFSLKSYKDISVFQSESTLEIKNVTEKINRIDESVQRMENSLRTLELGIKDIQATSEKTNAVQDEKIAQLYRKF